MTLIARWENGLLCPPYARVIALLGHFLKVRETTGSCRDACPLACHSAGYRNQHVLYKSR